MTAPRHSAPAELAPRRLGSRPGLRSDAPGLVTPTPRARGSPLRPSIETPLDRLGGRRRLLEAFAVASATCRRTPPSDRLYPHGHARTNAVFAADAARPTLAEILAAHGYDTAAFVSSFALDARFGLNRGFAIYDDEMVHTGEARIGFSERRGDGTTERAIAWLRTPRDRPYFLWVHYYDPHAKFDPPEPYASRSANRYDGEIAFMDAQLGRLLDAAEAASSVAIRSSS